MNKRQKKKRKKNLSLKKFDELFGNIGEMTINAKFSKLCKGYKGHKHHRLRISRKAHRIEFIDLYLMDKEMTNFLDDIMIKTAQESFVEACDKSGVSWTSGFNPNNVQRLILGSSCLGQDATDAKREHICILCKICDIAGFPDEKENCPDCRGTELVYSHESCGQVEAYLKNLCDIPCSDSLTNEQAETVIEQVLEKIVPDGEVFSREKFLKKFPRGKSDLEEWMSTIQFEKEGAEEQAPDD